MAKPTIFMDFDGFKFDTIPTHIAYINHRYGIKASVADFLKNPFLDLLINEHLPAHQQVTSENVYEDLSKNFLESIDWHKDVQPIKGMSEVIPKLAEKYTLITVTARQKKGLEVIMHLLGRHVPGCISDVHCVWEHLGNGVYNGFSKKEFIKKYDGEKIAFLDDSPNEILELQDILPSYLFDPNGVHDDDKRILHRVRSWEEIGNLFL